MIRVKFKRKLIVGLVIIVSIIGIIAVKASNKSATTSVPKSSEVLLNKSDVTPVVQESINDVVNFTGDLTAKEQTVISAEVDARITKIWVDEGQLVKAGQALAELDTLDLAQAVSQQQSQVAAAKSRLDLDKQKMEKQSELLKEGFVSQIAYDELVNNYQSSLENYKAQEAMLKRSQKQLSNTHIVAPFDGVIYQRSIDTGQLALKNTKLFALANLDKLEIKTAIPSDKISQVSVNQQVTFYVEKDTHEYHGQVRRVNQVSEPGTRSYMVYIDVANANSKLKAGQFVRGEILVQTLANQYVIPCSAIRGESQADYYVLAIKDQVVTKEKVNLVLTNQELGKCAVTGVTPSALILGGNVLTVKNGDHTKLVD